MRVTFETVLLRRRCGQWKCHCQECEMGCDEHDDRIQETLHDSTYFVEGAGAGVVGVVVLLLGGAVVRGVVRSVEPGAGTDDEGRRSANAK